jgi:phospholipase D1/2
MDRQRSRSMSPQRNTSLEEHMLTLRETSLHSHSHSHSHDSSSDDSDQESDSKALSKVSLGMRASSDGTHLANQQVLQPARQRTGTPAKTDRVYRAWCSWCFENTIHGRVAKNIVRRNVYKCQNCIRRTLVCRWCDDMVRGHRDWDDELCAKCDGTITQWGQTPENHRILGWCSWCLSLANHEFHIHNFMRRDGYRCETCGGRVAVCFNCNRNMARCTEFYDDKLCLKCDGTLEDWKDSKTNRTIAREKGLPLLSASEPYLPYAPLRRGIKAKFLVDGGAFMEAVADNIERATESIYMTFWFMNGPIYLRRTPGEPLNDDDRFDNMIKAAAERGVQVRILLWRENSPTFAVQNFSEEAKEMFEDLHPNIIVMRHTHPCPWTCVWAHHQKALFFDQNIVIVGGLDVCLGRYDTPEHRLFDTDAQTWPGKDYYQPMIGRPEDLDNFLTQDSVDRKHYHRMPWHDVDVQVNGLAARDLSRNFIQRWNHHKDVQYPYHNIEHLKLKNKLHYPADHERGTCMVQAVRSMDKWSGGSRNEQSIYGAYVRAIRDAEHYIYIENQYMSSNLAGAGVENKVAQYILDKLREKIRAKAKFRVIFLIPHPEETGDVAMIILKWQFKTISRGGSSLLEQLKEDFPDVDLSEYVSFFCLRTYEFIGDRPVTEMVFVHSKIMIVDDRTAIVSSANLNDRSFLGYRDSELGVVIHDEHMINIPMNGQQTAVCKAVHELRMQLWCEHLGLDEKTERDTILDPISDSVYDDIVRDTARRNLELFVTVFPGTPHNGHRTYDEWVAAGGLDVPLKAVTDGSELAGIRGHLVDMPVEFLLEGKPVSNHLYSQLIGQYLLQ